MFISKGDYSIDINIKPMSIFTVRLGIHNMKVLNSGCKTQDYYLVVYREG